MPTAARWKKDVLHDEAVPELEQPRYLLMLGDLDQLSLELQQVLGSDGFIGRLAFSRDADYEAYVAKVLRWAKRSASTQARTLFYTTHDGTRATSLGYQALISPSLKSCRERQSRGEFLSQDILEVGSQEDWSVDRLLEQAALPTPGVLFSLSHGLGSPRRGWRSVDEQHALQGAMSLGTEGMLEGAALASRPFLPGGLWFYLACFGAGTPSRSAFHTWLSQLRDAGQFAGRLEGLLASLPREGERPFVAALPKAVLANPEGPLAVIGHMDLAWSYSFQEQGVVAKSRPSRFQGLLHSLVAGRRAGVGLDALWRFFRDANHELTTLYEQQEEAQRKGRANPVDLAQRAHLWMLRQDLAGYVLLGDPAVQLPVPTAKPRTEERAASPQALAAMVLGLPVTGPETLPSAGMMDEAVRALLAGGESPKDIAKRAGVTLKELRHWEQVYTEAGRAALERLRSGRRKKGTGHHGCRHHRRGARPFRCSTCRLRGLLAPYVGMVRLVVAACNGGNMGALGNQLGSVAQALHGAGIVGPACGSMRAVRTARTAAPSCCAPTGACGVSLPPMRTGPGGRGEVSSAGSGPASSPDRS